MFSATKEVRFCFAHRIRGHPGRCQFLHGHNAKVKVRCEASGLNRMGMVLDFSRIKEAVADIAELWDHAVLLEGIDPLAGVLDGAGQRVYRFDAPPTAEVLAKAFFDAARAAGIPVAEVEFWETPSSMASHRKEER